MSTNVHNEKSHRSIKRMGVRALVVVLALSLLATPAAAQSEILCNSGSTTDLGGLVNSVIKMMFTLGIVAGLAMFKFNAIANMLTFSQGHKHRFKEKKSEVMKGTLVLIGVGPIFSFLSDTALNMGNCITFVPWG